MERMFHGCETFNQDLSYWDVSNVTNMRGMFHSADKFDQPIGDWDVSNVVDMGHMFGTSSLLVYLLIKIYQNGMWVTLQLWIECSLIPKIQSRYQ